MEFGIIPVNEIVANRQALSSVIVKSLGLNIREGTTHPTPIVEEKSTRRSISDENALQ